MGSTLIAVGVVVVGIAAYFLYNYYQQNHEERIAKLDTPRNRIVNDTNYNIDNTGVEDEYANLNKQEAKTVTQNWEKTGYIPSDEEFYDVKEELDKP